MSLGYESLHDFVLGAFRVHCIPTYMFEGKKKPHVLVL